MRERVKSHPLAKLSQQDKTPAAFNSGIRQPLFQILQTAEILSQCTNQGIQPLSCAGIRNHSHFALQQAMGDLAFTVRTVCTIWPNSPAHIIQHTSVCLKHTSWDRATPTQDIDHGWVASIQPFETIRMTTAFQRSLLVCHVCKLSLYEIDQLYIDHVKKKKC